MNENEALSDVAQQNAVVLAAVSGLISDVVREVSGNEISNSVCGQSLTADVAQILINQELVEQMKKG